MLERFGPTKALGMATIIKERYTLNDAARHRESCEYAMTIVRAAKIAKLGETHNHLDVIWNGLDVEFQSDIASPTIHTELNDMLLAMDLRKNQWWTKAARITKSHAVNTQRQQPNQGKNNSGQYTSSRNLPSRPAGNQNPGY